MKLIEFDERALIPISHNTAQKLGALLSDRKPISCGRLFFCIKYYNSKHKSHHLTNPDGKSKVNQLIIDV